MSSPWRTGRVKSRLSDDEIRLVTRDNKKRVGNIYLLHITITHGDDDQELVIHYIGSTQREIDERFEEHLRGDSCAFLRALFNTEPDPERPRRRLPDKIKEVRLEVARPWEGYDLSVEFRLKAWGGARPFCPVCSGKRAYKRAQYTEFKKRG